MSPVGAMRAALALSACLAALSVYGGWIQSPRVESVSIEEADRALVGVPWRPWRCGLRRRIDFTEGNHFRNETQLCDVGPLEWTLYESVDNMSETGSLSLSASAQFRCESFQSTGDDARFDLQVRSTWDGSVAEYRCAQPPVHAAFWAVRVGRRGPITLLPTSEPPPRVGLGWRLRQWPPWASLALTFALWRAAHRQRFPDDSVAKPSPPEPTAPYREEHPPSPDPALAKALTARQAAHRRRTRRMYVAMALTLLAALSPLAMHCFGQIFRALWGNWY